MTHVSPTVKELGKFNETSLSINSTNFWFLGSKVQSNDTWTTGNINYSVISSDLKDRCLKEISNEVSIITDKTVKDEVCANISSINNNISIISSDLSTLSINTVSNINSISTDISTISSYADEISSYADEISSYADEISGYADEISSYADEISGYADEISTKLEKEISNISSVISGIDKETLDKLKDLSSFKLELETLTNNITKLSTNVENIKTDLYSYVDIEEVKIEDKSAEDTESTEENTNTDKKLSCVIKYNEAGYTGIDSVNQYINTLSTYLENHLEISSEDQLSDIPEDIYKPYSAVDAAIDLRDNNDTYKLRIISSEYQLVISGQSLLSISIPPLSDSSIFDPTDPDYQEDLYNLLNYLPIKIRSISNSYEIIEDSEDILTEETIDNELAEIISEQNNNSEQTLNILNVFLQNDNQCNVLVDNNTGKNIKLTLSIELLYQDVGLKTIKYI